MIDKVSGKIAYAVVSFGGFLGMGEKYFTMPWGVLKYHTSLEGYRTDMTEDQLRGTPRFNRNWSDRSRDRTTYELLSVAPLVQHARALTTHRGARGVLMISLISLTGRRVLFASAVPEQEKVITSSGSAARTECPGVAGDLIKPWPLSGASRGKIAPTEAVVLDFVQPS